jgi:hypothetical protein
LHRTAILDALVTIKIQRDDRNLEADSLKQLSDLFQTHSTPCVLPEQIIASGSAIDPAGYEASTKVKCKKRHVLSTHRVSRCTPSHIEMAERYQTILRQCSLKLLTFLPMNRFNPRINPRLRKRASEESAEVVLARIRLAAIRA